MVKSTKNRRPLILLYFEIFEEKSKAFATERWSKSLEGGATLKERLKEKELLNENGLIKLTDNSAG
jgi:putative endonuclease